MHPARHILRPANLTVEAIAAPDDSQVDDLTRPPGAELDAALKTAGYTVFDNTPVYVENIARSAGASARLRGNSRTSAAHKNSQNRYKGFASVTQTRAVQPSLP